jgi:hypothetical protein
MGKTEILDLIEAELVDFSDVEIIDFIKTHLIDPAPLDLAWDYGEPDVKFRGWSVLEDAITGTRIVYCEQGFGPTNPWGLVSCYVETPSMGQDTGWFTTFLDAFFDSLSSTRLQIYQVVVTDQDGNRSFIGEPGGWDDAWQQVEALRASGNEGHFDVETLRYPKRQSVRA